eukprot:31364-Pelagococcus_subviridis.AAC.6
MINGRVTCVRLGEWRASAPVGVRTTRLVSHLVEPSSPPPRDAHPPLLVLEPRLPHDAAVPEHPQRRVRVESQRLALKVTDVVVSRATRGVTRWGRVASRHRRRRRRRRRRRDARGGGGGGGCSRAARRGRRREHGREARRARAMRRVTTSTMENHPSRKPKP